MSDYIFLFDLDSTLTKEEILPKIATTVDKYNEMRKLTDECMSGLVDFKTSFCNRVNLLKNINVSIASEMISKTLVNEKLMDFVKRNKDRCFIVTGNLDCWIEKLLDKYDLRDSTFCSKTRVVNDKLIDILYLLDKEKIANSFIKPIVVIGDGSNDCGMAKYASITIGYGGVKDISPKLLDMCDYKFYKEEDLLKKLNELL